MFATDSHQDLEDIFSRIRPELANWNCCLCIWLLESIWIEYGVEYVYIVYWQAEQYEFELVTENYNFLENMSLRFSCDSETVIVSYYYSVNIYQSLPSNSEAYVLEFQEYLEYVYNYPLFVNYIYYLF